MYQVASLTDGRTLLGFTTPTEAAALHWAIEYVTDTGVDVVVEFGDPDTDIGMHEVWRVQADTKVDEKDPTFPAIVHIGALQREAREATA